MSGRLDRYGERLDEVEDLVEEVAPMPTRAEMLARCSELRRVLEETRERREDQP